jgi:hypothetical protein
MHTGDLTGTATVVCRGRLCVTTLATSATTVLTVHVIRRET